MPPEETPVPPVETPPVDPPKDPKVFDEAYVKTLRTEAAANRKKADELEAKLKEREDADLSEAQKLAKRAEDAEAKVTASQGRVARAESKVKAAELNIINPDTAYKLIKDDITFDKDGEPENLTELLTALVKDNPFLVKTDQQSSGNPGNPAGGRGGQAPKLDPKHPPSWGAIYRK